MSMFDSSVLKDLMMVYFVGNINNILGTHYDWYNMTNKMKRKFRKLEKNFKWPVEEIDE